MGVRLGANLDLGLGDKSWFTGASRWRPGGARWTLEQLLHLAIAAVAILGWGLVYVTLMRGIEPPHVVGSGARTEVSVNLAPPLSPGRAPATH